MVVLFLLPRVGAIVDLVFFGVAHDHDLAAEGLLTLLDEMGETVAYPVHLVLLGFRLGLKVVRVVVHMDIVEFRLRRGIWGRYTTRRGDGL
jgi:hypothetical protein